LVPMLAEVNEPTHVAAVAEERVEAGKELLSVILNCAGDTEPQKGSKSTK